MRVAFVVARCGDEVVGGAESLCLQIAQHLSATADVEILTTCASDYRTWSNVHPPGPAEVGGVRVRRFAVDAARDVPAFDALSRRIAADPQRAPIEQQAAWMRAQGPLASQLFAYVREEAARYDAIVFFGYLYATTYFALPAVAEKAVLMPLAHDEWMIRLPMWDGIFRSARAIVFATDHERAFVEQRFRDLPKIAAMVAAGAEPPADRDAERFRERFGITEPYLLYLGRIDPSKGVDALLDDFRRYRSSHPAPLKLVLVGSLHSDVPDHPDIVATGPVDDRTKWDAIEGCELLVLPSQFESLSLVLLEAWSCARAVLVNARSPVLAGQCRRANGGLWYGSYDEFAGSLEVLDRPTRDLLGAQGRAYVADAYGWDAAVATLTRVLSAVSSSREDVAD